MTRGHHPKGGPAVALAAIVVLVLAADHPSGGARAAAAPGTATAVRLEGFEDASAWSAHPADGVELKLSNDAGLVGRSLRLDVRFVKGGGYAVARRRIDWTMPDRYRLRFRVRGEIGPENLEFKLVDASGDNVWWSNQRDFAFSARWDTVTLRERHVQFAWGPLGGGPPRNLAFLEFAITAGSGGAGTVWLDELELEPLPPPSAHPPPMIASATSARRGAPAAAAVDGDSASAWSPAPGDRAPALTLDLGEPREFGGLTLRWRGRPADHAVELSDDGARWRAGREVRDAPGGREHVRLPESEARYVRLRLLPGRRRGGALADVAVRPLGFGTSPDAFVSVLAREAPRGDYPRAYLGEQSYWTVVGLDADADEGLLDEDARLEVGKGAFSLEPFLFADGRLLTWADGASEARLEDGDLPISSVRRMPRPLSLEVTALADGVPDSSRLIVRYRVGNDGLRPARVTLYLAVRPFQVNPPQQFLNTNGGWSPIRLLEARAGAVTVNAARTLRVAPAAAWGATTQDAGGIVASLRDGRLPARRDVRDESGGASGAFAWVLDLPPGGHRDVIVAASEAGDDVAAGTAVTAAAFGARLAAARAAWRERLHRVDLELPPAAGEVARTLRAQIGWILVNRDGPALQPGSRAYERSWIRDGALTSSALLRLGHAQAARDFLDWFAPYQYENGKVPCCVDRRGSDAVPEHDSSGEFIFLVAEVTRMTGDTTVARRHWPRVRAAAAYLDSLRHTRRTAEYAADSLRHFYGLLPPSISHEGYSAKPMHSYWDDLFALRGFQDAAWLAGRLGLAAESRRLAAIRDEFARDLAASIERARAKHGIAFIPGCADLGDFDATSTAIGVAPLDLAAALPKGALDATFDRYMQFFRRRRDGAEAWDAMTPYETRIVGAMVRLGRRDDANELLEWFMTLRRPPGFAHWAEVVDCLPRHARFLGDMPHTWVGSDFARSVLDMLCYERDSDESVVLAAGVPWAWTAGPTGARALHLPTPYGRVDLTLRADGDALEASVGGDARTPPGGFVLAPPARRAFRSATVDGAPATLRADGTLVLRRLPARVRLSP